MFFTKERATSPLFLAFGSSSCEPREPSDAGHFNKAENARCLPPRPRSTSAALCRVASRSVRVASALEASIPWIKKGQYPLSLSRSHLALPLSQTRHRCVLLLPEVIAAPVSPLHFPSSRQSPSPPLSLSLVQTLTLATQPPWTTKLMPPWLTGVVLSMAAGLGRC
jgi:hypothetical protein